MFIVITGLDGSGTSSIAEGLAKIDKNSSLLKTPSKEYSGREIIDSTVRKDSILAHFLYYLSSTSYMSDYIKNNLDYKNSNVYCVRYLIDTVVSNVVAGIDVELDYNIYGKELLKPDLTIFVELDEKIRQERISKRGKSELDKVLDDENKRMMFLKQFNKLLDKSSTIYVKNDKSDISITVEKLYEQVKKYGGYHE